MFLTVIHCERSSSNYKLALNIKTYCRCDERDLLMQDFMTVETVAFPKTGSSTTPAHSYSDFTFRTFAPLAFRYFLQLFSVKKDDFMVRKT